jgi:hypothetical protein
MYITKKPKATSIFTKYLASFAKNVAPLNPSSHSLSPFVNLHSHHTMPLSNKSSQSLSANTTLNHKLEIEEKK